MNTGVAALMKHEKVWHSANKKNEAKNSTIRITSAGISMPHNNVNADLELTSFTTPCKVVKSAINRNTTIGVEAMTIKDSSASLPGEMLQVYPMSVPSQSVRTPCSVA